MHRKTRQKQLRKRCRSLWDLGRLKQERERERESFLEARNSDGQGSALDSSSTEWMFYQGGKKKEQRK